MVEVRQTDFATLRLAGLLVRVRSGSPAKLTFSAQTSWQGVLQVKLSPSNSLEPGANTFWGIGIWGRFLHEAGSVNRTKACALGNQTGHECGVNMPRMWNPLVISQFHANLLECCASVWSLGCWRLALFWRTWCTCQTSWRYLANSKPHSFKISKCNANCRWQTTQTALRRT